MQQPIELTLEQKFDLKAFETEVQQMTREQAQELLMKLYEQMLVRETEVKQQLRQQWGIELPAIGGDRDD